MQIACINNVKFFIHGIFFPLTTIQTMLSFMLFILEQNGRFVLAFIILNDAIISQIIIKDMVFPEVTLSRRKNVVFLVSFSTESITTN